MNEKKTIVSKRIVYTISTLLLCVVALFRADGNGDWWRLGINLIGICVLPILVMRLNPKSFLKIPYLVWLVIALPIACIIIKKYYYETLHRNAFAALVLEVFFYGFILIRFIIGIIKKEFKGNLKKLNPLFWVTLAFFFLSAISKNEAIWPVYLGLVFTFFYLAPADKKDNEILFISLCDGLIVAFFLIQSFAFLHRPYDKARYLGSFTNSNVNGMFYVCAFVAWLSKYIHLTKKNAKRWIRYIHLAFASAMISFAVITMCRSAMGAMVIVTPIFLLLDTCINKKGFWKGFILKGVCMVLIAAISFPIVFGCIRYIPALRHHPIWISDYSEDDVHSYDPWNSEKYIDWDEFVGALTGRFDPDNIDNRGTIIQKEEVLLPENNSAPIMLLAEGEGEPVNEEVAADVPEEPTGEYIEIDGVVISYPDNVHPGQDSEHPAYKYETYEGIEKIFGIRKYIFGYYFRNMNFAGHEPEYPTAFLLPWYEVPHAHNTFLQIGYCFGRIPGILFLGISLFASIFPIVYAIIKKDKTSASVAFAGICQSALLIVGVTENIAFPGKMMFSLFFITLVLLMRKNEETKVNDNDSKIATETVAADSNS